MKPGKAVSETGAAFQSCHSQPAATTLRGAGGADGAQEAIIHVYDDGGYEVEFIAGQRPIVLTLEADEIEAVGMDS